MMLDGLNLTDTTLCLFNYGTPGDNDSAKDCSNFAVWHIQYHTEAGYRQTQCCEEHFTLAMIYNGEVDSFHEFMSACNLPNSWFDRGLDICYTEERGLELGLLTIVQEAK